MTPGSIAPRRVPIIRPSTAVKPIVFATLRPSFTAHMLAPLPRWAKTTRALASTGASSRSREARFPLQPSFCGRAGTGRGSGGDGIGFEQPDELIGGEGEDAEHEKAFDLDGAADPAETTAELVFQPGVDPFGHGSEVVDDRRRSRACS
jgi:hypothetical protein